MELVAFRNINYLGAGKQEGAEDELRARLHARTEPVPRPPVRGTRAGVAGDGAPDRELPRHAARQLARGARRPFARPIDSALHDAVHPTRDPKQIEAMTEASKETLARRQWKRSREGRARRCGFGHIRHRRSARTVGIDDFAKLDLRIGKVLACSFVDGSDKLLRFELDAGELGTRQIFSGIRASYGESRRSWSGAASSSSPIWRRARCALA